MKSSEYAKYISGLYIKYIREIKNVETNMTSCRIISLLNFKLTRFKVNNERASKKDKAKIILKSNLSNLRLESIQVM